MISGATAPILYDSQHAQLHHPPVDAGQRLTFGQANDKRGLQRWRIFYMASAELWGYADGTQWQVSHDRLKNDPQ